MNTDSNSTATVEAPLIQVVDDILKCLIGNCARVARFVRRSPVLEVFCNSKQNDEFRFMTSVPSNLTAAVMARLKLMGGLSISRRHDFQIGQIQYRASNDQKITILVIPGIETDQEEIVLIFGAIGGVKECSLSFPSIL